MLRIGIKKTLFPSSQSFLISLSLSFSFSIFLFSLSPSLPLLESCSASACSQLFAVCNLLKMSPSLSRLAPRNECRSSGRRVSWFLAFCLHGYFNSFSLASSYQSSFYFFFLILLFLFLRFLMTNIFLAVAACWTLDRRNQGAAVFLPSSLVGQTFSFSSFLNFIFV